MGASVSSRMVRPAGEGDLPKGAADLRHALLTDPDGVFAACGEGTVAAGIAAGVVRGDVLTVVHFEVAREARGRGIGSALWAAVRSYGVSRGARTVEFVRPADEATLGFLLRAGLPVRGVALRLRAESHRALAGPEVPLTPMQPGPALTGWVADLDRETRGFPRSVDWSVWSRSGSELFAARRRGRPVAIGALTLSPEHASLGPVAAATPEAASELVLALAAKALRHGTARIEVTLPSEARLPLAEALRAGFRLAGSFPLLAGRSRGDLRRYAASPTAFF
ncbi:MAG: GNAT family N-acetyltransferase [Acidithiobacillales bacterium]